MPFGVQRAADIPFFHSWPSENPLEMIIFAHVRQKKANVWKKTQKIKSNSWWFASVNLHAFRYLNNWKGLAFLEEFYDVEHLLSIEDAVDDLTVVCKKNGGMLA